MLEFYQELPGRGRKSARGVASSENTFVHPLRFLVSFVVKNAVSRPVRPIQVQIGLPSTDNAEREI